jgi:hypothetical protein
MDCRGVPHRRSGGCVAATRPERAPPRAQQRAMSRRHQTLTQRPFLQTLLRPETAALQRWRWLTATGVAAARQSAASLSPLIAGAFPSAATSEPRPSVSECGDSSPLWHGGARLLTSCLGSRLRLARTLAPPVLVRLSCLCANAQSYSIDGSTVDGGGGSSTGGVYGVSGTIGQPAAARVPAVKMPLLTGL